MKKYLIIMAIILGLFSISFFYIVISDVTDKSIQVAITKIKKVNPFPITGKLPDNLIWLDGNEQKSFADENAKRGGIYNSFLSTFPKTLRQVGPESNAVFRSYLDEQDMRLVNFHPKTNEYYPSLAKAWAIGDERTVYFKLDEDARWNNGEKVTADDYIFALKFYRSPSLLAPWYNDYFSRFFDEVIKIDDYTIAVRLNKAKPDLIYNCNLSPIAYHFYGKMRKVKQNYPIDKGYSILQRDKKIISVEIEKKYQNFKKIIQPTKKQIDASKIEIEIEDVVEDYVDRYDWQVPPKTGAYRLTNYIKGQKVVFERLKNWWANDKKFYKNRYNVDCLSYTVIRDLNTAFDIFSKGDLDIFSMTLPPYWHTKSKKLLEWEYLRYMTRLWYYNDKPRPSYLLSMNMAKPLLKEIDIRLGIAHSLNFAKMIEVALKSDYHQASTIATGYGKYTNKDLKARQYDIELAHQYFKKAGFDKFATDGVLLRGEKRLSIEILYGYEGHTERLLILKQGALKVGLELKLKLVGGGSSFSQMLAKKHQLAWHGWSTGLRPSYWGEYHGSNASKPNTNNFTNMNNPKVNELIDAYRDSTNDEERIDLSKKIQQQVHHLASAIPTIVVPYFRESYWNWLKFPRDMGKNIDSITSNGVFWLDEKVKIHILKLKKKLLKNNIKGEAIQIINKVVR